MIINSNFPFKLSIKFDSMDGLRVFFEDRYSRERVLFVEGLYVIDDSVNCDEYCKTISNERFSAKAYICIKKDSVKIYQKPFVIDNIYYSYEKDKIIVSNVFSNFYSKPISKSNSSLFLKTGILPPKKTLLENVFRIEGGEILLIEAHENRLMTKTIWLTPEWLEYVENNSMEIVTGKNLNSLLVESINMSLCKRNPDNITILLSGGIDSGVIAFLLKDNKNIKDKYAYTASYNTEAGKNEASLASLRAKAFGYKHEVLYFDSDTFKEVVESSFDLMDYPVGDPPAILEAYLVNQAYKKSLKYFYSGELADTLFGGGNTFIAEKYLNYFRFLFNIIKRTEKGKKYMRKLRSAISEGSSFERQMRIWLPEEACNPEYDLYLKLGERIKDNLRMVSAFQLFTVRNQLDHSKIYLAKKNRDIFYSLPFENLAVAEYGLALKESDKVRNLKSKYLIRETYGSKLPGKKVKQSYAPPVALWLDEKYLSYGHMPFSIDSSDGTNVSPENGDKAWRYYIYNRWYEKKYKIKENDVHE